MNPTSTPDVAANEYGQLYLNPEFVPEKQKIEQDLNFDWMTATGLNCESLRAALEGLIFLSDKPISIEKLRSLISPSIPLRIIYDQLQFIQQDCEKSNRGIRLQEVSKGYQFRTKGLISKYAQDFYKVTPLEITPSAMEVLAIIAYKGPISKSEVEKLRGVDSSHLIRTLMDKRLVKVMGRSEEELGRPTVYATTAEFLEVFSLNSLDSLPPEYELSELLSQQDMSKVVDISQLLYKDQQRKFAFDDAEELSLLKSQLESIQTHTPFTRELTKPSEEKKSAFDVLESFIEKGMIAEENARSAESELLVPALEAKIISDLSPILINAPDPDSIEDEDLFTLTTQDVSLAEEKAELAQKFSEIEGREEVNAMEDEESNQLLSDKERVLEEKLALFQQEIAKLTSDNESDFQG